jgi:Icc-related predicted phosphoesterase
LKLVLISDTHEKHNALSVPDGDVLVHAGDLTYRGDFDAVLEATQWLRKLPHKHKVVIAGNHDFLFEKKPASARSLMDGIHYLENESIVIDGVKFYGSPVQPWFYDWAFNVQRGEAIRKYWDMMPEDTDVLITHGPPKGFQDQSVPHKNTEHLGCYDLLEAVLRIKPKIHVFGHIHGGYGYQRFEGTQFYNASVVNEAYKLTNDPFVVEI